MKIIREILEIVFLLVIGIAIGMYFYSRIEVKAKNNPQFVDAIWCEEPFFVTKDVRIIEHSGTFFIHYPSGKWITVTGKCIVEKNEKNNTKVVVY